MTTLIRYCGGCLALMFFLTLASCASSWHTLPARETPFGLFLQAREAQRTYDDEKAHALYARLLRQQSDPSPFLRYATSYFFVQEGDLSQAIAFIDLSREEKHYLTKREKLILYWFSLALDIKSRHYHEALVKMDNFSAHAKETQSYALFDVLLRAWATAGEGRIEPAISTIFSSSFTRAVLPMEGWRFYNAGLIYSLAHQPTRAASSYARALLMQDKPNNFVLQAYYATRRKLKYQQDPFHYTSLVFDARNPFADQLRWMVQNRRTILPSIVSLKDGVANVFIQTALAFRAAKDARIVPTMLNIAAALWPRGAIVHIVRGISLERQGFKDAAWAEYLAISSDSPFYIFSQAKIAMIEGTSSRVRMGEKRMMRLVARYPNNAMASFYYASYLSRSPWKERAIDAYGKAIELFEKQGASLYDRAPLYYARARLERLQGHKKAYLLDLEQAFQGNPRDPLILRDKVDVWIETKERWGLAQVLLAQALRKQPGRALLWYSLGRLCRARADLECAAHAFEEAIHFDARALYHIKLGDVFFQQGHALQARYEWTYALQTLKEGPLRRLVLSRLKKKE